MPKSKDGTLIRIVKEVAEELDVDIDTVWRVYEHFIKYIYKLMTLHDMKNFNTEKRRELAQNIVIPGLGRLLNKYGKTYRPIGTKETKKEVS